MLQTCLGVYWGTLLSQAWEGLLAAKYLVASWIRCGGARQTQKTQMSSAGELVIFGGGTHLLGLQPSTSEDFSCILGHAGDTESKLTLFKVFIVEAVVKSCGQKVTGGCLGGNFRTCWWTPEVKEVVKLEEGGFSGLVGSGVCKSR